MKICNLSPPNTKKLCHRKRGDIVRICKNDMSEPDNSIYLVMGPSRVSRVQILLVDVVTGRQTFYNSSSRCIHYPKAALLLNGDIEDCNNDN